VADVRFMFNTATAFNQDLSSWQVNGIYAIYWRLFQYKRNRLDIT